jgi:hypothetical protein
MTSILAFCCIHLAALFSHSVASARTLLARYSTARKNTSSRAHVTAEFSLPSMAPSLVVRRQNRSRACVWKCAAKIWLLQGCRGFEKEWKGRRHLRCRAYRTAFAWRFPSSTITKESTGRLCNTSNVPLGHRISSVSTLSCFPSPKKIRGSCAEQ